MHWLAQCHAKWPRAASSFSTLWEIVRIEPKLPGLLETAWTTEPWVCMKLYPSSKKTGYDSSYLATWNLFFACRIMIVVFRLLRLNIKARHNIPEFLNTNLWLMHLNNDLIAFNIDWSWNIFTLHNFCSMLIEQLINLEKCELRSWNWGQIFKIKLLMAGQ